MNQKICSRLPTFAGARRLFLMNGAPEPRS
jgi:hypothetical protein